MISSTNFRVTMGPFRVTRFIVTALNAGAFPVLPIQ